MDIHVDIRGFLEIHAWICYGFSDQGTRYIFLSDNCRRTWEQDTIIKQMAQSVAEFDEEVEKMTEQRLLAQRDSNLIRLRIIALTHELNIIKACEAREEHLMSRVTDKELEKKAMMQQVRHYSAKTFILLSVGG